MINDCAIGGQIGLRLGQMAHRLFGARAALVKFCRVEEPIDGAVLGKAEFEVVTVPMVNGVDNPWLEMFGAFRDSVYFDDVVKIIEADRAALGDEDVDPAVYRQIESA
jgi:hypothetical protein